MKTLNLVQGSPEWHEHRSKTHNASELSVVMGVSQYKTREQLIEEKALQREAKVSTFVEEVVFERGRETEKAARLQVEAAHGVELYPVVATSDDGFLSASYDGITLDRKLVWEGKQANADKAEAVKEGIIPACDIWQCLQLLCISGAERLIYTVGVGEEMVETTLESDAGMEKTIRMAWAQFDKEVDEYFSDLSGRRSIGSKSIAATTIKAQEYVFDLPALTVEVSGMVTRSNLDEFKSSALAFVGSLKTELTTDEDFANAAEAVKWCTKAEKALDEAKERALSSTASIKELFDTMDEIKEAVRAARLTVSKAQKEEKERAKGEVLAYFIREGERVLRDSREKVHPYGALIDASVDFKAAMHGKKLIQSMREACLNELANLRLEVGLQADALLAKMKKLDQLTRGYEPLFQDRERLLGLPIDSLAALVEGRIKEEEARKLAEEARIRAEEEARVRAEEESRRKAEEARIRAEEESKRRADEARIRADEQEKARIRAEEEARVRAEEESRRKAEEARIRADEQEKARIMAEKKAAVQKRVQEVERLEREKQEAIRQQELRVKEASAPQEFRPLAYYRRYYRGCGDAEWKIFAGKKEKDEIELLIFNSVLKIEEAIKNRGIQKC
jgi:putative phage-type endonuclease